MNRRERRANAKIRLNAANRVLTGVGTASDPQQIVEASHELFRLGRIEAAKPGLRAALARHPDHTGVRAALAYAQASTGQVAEAVEHYRILLSLQRDSAPLRTNLAVLLLQLQRSAEARALLEQALALAPNHPNTAYVLAELLSRENREHAFKLYWKAIRLFRAAIGGRPGIEHCPDLVKLANAEVWAGELAAAMAHYDRATTLRPDYALAHARRGLALLKLKRQDEAVRALRRAATLEPNYAEAQRAIGEILMDQGDLAGASRHLSVAMRINPRDELARYFFAATSKSATPGAAPTVYIKTLFDEYAANFDHHLVDVLKYRAPELLCEAVLEHVSTVPRISTAIDLGCGTGLCGPLLKPPVARLIGVDLSEGMLAKARSRGIYDELVQADLVEALARFDGELDLAVAADVFVYVGNLEPAVAACRRALRPGGLLGFTVEAGSGQSFALETTGRYVHSRSYLQSLAERHGLEVVRCGEIVARHQGGRPVDSLLTVLRRER